MAWVAPADLSRYEFPAADAALIDKLAAWQRPLTLCAAPHTMTSQS